MNSLRCKRCLGVFACEFKCKQVLDLHSPQLEPLVYWTPVPMETQCYLRKLSRYIKCRQPCEGSVFEVTTGGACLPWPALRNDSKYGGTARLPRFVACAFMAGSLA